MVEMDRGVFYDQWLQSIADLPGRAARKIQELFPEPEELFASPKERFEEMLPPGQRKNLLLAMEKTGEWQGMQNEYEQLKEKGISFVSIREKDFPARLTQIPDPPLGIYYRGNLPQKNHLAVAIIGSRDCSEYGRSVAAELGKFLGERGIDVISGMARGIDGISQRAALEAGGNSYGVLGSGADVCYPASNQPLYDQLLERGGILSAYPPGTPPISRNFPPRNRIVSGLADALVVVEARLKSGTLITVDMALEQGKDVYAVPGRVTDRLSDGCNRLLKQGAEIYSDPAAFLEELEEGAFLKQIMPMGMGVEKHRKKDGKENIRAEGGREENGSRTAIREELRPIWNCLDDTPRSLEEIQGTLDGKYSVTQLGVFLMELTMEGKARQISAGFFCRG